MKNHKQKMNRHKKTSVKDEHKTGFFFFPKWLKKIYGQRNL